MSVVNTEPRHSIKVAARKTGLSPHVIRIWEKRYKAVSPQRTPTNRRLYSDADIERLRLLQRATQAGHSIGQIVGLSLEELNELVAADNMSVTAQPTHAVTPQATERLLPESYLDTCLDAIKRLDAKTLESTLTRAAVALSQPALLEQLIIPLMQRVGDLWRGGLLKIAHEHLASAIVRTVLGSLEETLSVSQSGPSLVVTTPTGQFHEIGALIAAVTAASEGWRVIYLGPNLPAEEIAGAAQQSQAKAVLLSIVYPSDDPHLVNELKKLRRYLAPETDIVVGGRAADAYNDTLREIGAVILHDMLSLRAYLETLRSRR
ncbi:MAG: MerR family transcriptional regulator [Abditibacteriales bacterium]|nr:MerR family transcriptional regulator [Abditibacteriales bacterium]